MHRWILAAALWPGVALAWEPLDGPGIETALTGRTVIYDAFTVQVFHSNGTTDYVTERMSSGQWEVRGDAYCSTWPPSDSWTCYAVEIEAEQVRFTPETGFASVGRFAE